MRKQKAAQHVIDETFPDDGTEETELNRSLMNEILSGGTEHIKENYARLKKEALDAWGEMIGVKPYLDYKGQGTGIISYVGEHGGWEGTRVTANEGWYSQFYKEHGRAPGERERYDIADRGARAPMEASNDPEAAAELKNISAAKSRVEALEGLDTVIKGLDIPDLEARSLLSEKSYDLVYKPILKALENGPQKSAKAARESAILMGRMADTFAAMYGVPVERIIPEIMNGVDGNTGTLIYGMAAKEMNETVHSLQAFRKQLAKDMKNGWEASSEKWTDDNGITFFGDRLIHIENNHDITSEQLSDLGENIGTLWNVAISNKKNILQFDGVPVLAMVKGKKFCYRVTFRFLKNGSVKFISAFVGNEQGIKNDIEAHAARVLSDDTAAHSPGQGASMSIQSIQNSLGIVKKKHYNQMAGENAKTANMKALKQAKRMLRSGKHMEEISKETGWSVGMDGRWRFYIPDHLDQFDTKELVSRLETNQSVSLAEIYWNSLPLQRRSMNTLGFLPPFLPPFFIEKEL